MKRLFLILTLTVSTLIVATAPGATGAETAHFSFKGQFAEAEFFNVDPSECVFTDVFVTAVDGRVKEAGHPAVSSMAFVFISQFDDCTGTDLLAAEGEATLAAGAFQIDEGLTTATLNATIEVTDFLTDTSFPVDVSVSWTGSGPTFRQKDHFQLKTPGFKVNAHFDGTFRDAMAAGTVSDGTTDFTPDPAVFADMASIKQGEVDISH